MKHITKRFLLLLVLWLPLAAAAQNPMPGDKVTISDVCAAPQSRYMYIVYPPNNNTERQLMYIAAQLGTPGAPVSTPPMPGDVILIDSLCNYPDATFKYINYPLSNNTERLLAYLDCNWSGGGGGSGTVTSVATGFGLKGGTITTTGTLYADTTRDSGLPTYYYVDSLYNTTTPIVYIDSLWRTPGVDSIYFSKNGNTYAIKDSIESGWSLTGNTGTNSGVNFIGTTDDASLEFRVNDTTAMFIDSSNRHIGIGTVTPDADLEINGDSGLFIQSSIPNYTGLAMFGNKNKQGINGFNYQNGSLYQDTSYLFVNALENHGLLKNRPFTQGAWLNSDSSAVSFKRYYPAKTSFYGLDTSYHIIFYYDKSHLFFVNQSTINFRDSSLANFFLNSSANFYDTSSAEFFESSSSVFHDSSSLSIIGNSKFRFSTGSQGEQKILTSDSLGYATWKDLDSLNNNSFWNTTGNSGTNSGVNFIGTTDDASLEFRVNDTTAMFIDSSNRHVGIGTVTPDADAMLHVEGLTPLYLHGSIPSVIEGSFSFGLKTTTAANGYDYQNGYVIDNYLFDETGINAFEYHGLGNAGAFVQGAWVNSDGSPRSYKKYYPTGGANYGIDTSYKVKYVYDNSNLHFLDNSSLLLDDSSTFQFATGSEGEHKVLTSDADGYATWQPLNQDTVFVPTTSSTDTLQDGYTGAILDAGATGITGYTLTMPPNPYEGQRILVSLADGTTFGMGYFAVDGNGSTVKANYMMVNNVQYTFRYKNGTWY